MFKNNSEEILSLQPTHHSMLVGRDRSRITVVNNQRPHRRVRFSQRLAKLTHVDGAGISSNKIGPLESRSVEFEKSARAQYRAASRVSPCADQRRQAEDIAYGHGAACVTLQTVVDTNKRGRVGCIFVTDALDGVFGNAGDLRDA